MWKDKDALLVLFYSEIEKTYKKNKKKKKKRIESMVNPNPQDEQKPIRDYFHPVFPDQQYGDSLCAD